MAKNLQSIRSDNKFQDFIAELENCDFDILLVSETWRDKREESYRNWSWSQGVPEWWFLQEWCWYLRFAEVVGSNFWTYIPHNFWQDMLFTFHDRHYNFQTLVHANFVGAGRCSWTCIWFTGDVACQLWSGRSNSKYWRRFQCSDWQSASWRRWWFAWYLRVWSPKWSRLDACTVGVGTWFVDLKSFG